MEVLYFILLVGVLVFVHESGHFVFAKLFGVRVLRLSLGFGPKVAGFTRGGTEYVIAAFPLGGYVRLLGESPDEGVDEAEAQRALSNQPIWSRIVIALAGPATNLVFPILLFFVVHLGDTTMTPAVVGTVLPDSPADGLLVAGDAVLRVDSEEISTFYELAEAVGDRAGQSTELLVERDGERRVVVLTPAREEIHRPLGVQDEVGRIGIRPHHPLAVVGVLPSGPAAAAGLQTFDRIVSAGRTSIERWLQLEELLASNRGGTVPVSYLRPERVDNALGGLIELDVYRPGIATLTPNAGEGTGVRRAGLELADVYVHTIRTAGGAELGIQPRDRLEALDGQQLRSWGALIQRIDESESRQHELTLSRGESRIILRLGLRSSRSLSGDTTDERIIVSDRHGATIGALEGRCPVVLDPLVSTPNLLPYAAERAVVATLDWVRITIASMTQLFDGLDAFDSIGGPLRMFEATGVAARQGAMNYLSLMAFISINLGLINLLPVPVLDGGHILFFLIEAIGRRPVSAKFREWASLFGLVLLILVMIVAFKNDLSRHWPRIVDTFTEQPR